MTTTLNLREPLEPKPFFQPETLGVILKRWIKASLEQYREWILVFLGGYVLLLLYAGAWWWGRKWDKEECLEALKAPSQGVVIMAVCRSAK